MALQSKDWHCNFEAIKQYYSEKFLLWKLRDMCILPKMSNWKWNILISQIIIYHGLSWLDPNLAWWQSHQKKVMFETELYFVFESKEKKLLSIDVRFVDKHLFLWFESQKICLHNQCDICDQTFISSVWVSQKIRLYNQCDICDKTFISLLQIFQCTFIMDVTFVTNNSFLCLKSASMIDVMFEMKHLFLFFDT